MLDFEEEREANIARNLAALMAIGIEEESKFMVKKKAPPKPKKKPQRKRKEAPSAADGDDDSAEPPTKAVALADGDASAGPRRSGRNAGKKVDYAGDGDNLGRNDGPRMVTEKARVKEMSGQKGTMKRVHDPCVGGSCLVSHADAVLRYPGRRLVPFPRLK